MSYFREKLENWLATIDVTANRVIDIGGASKPVKDRVRSWNVKDYKIADIGAEHPVVENFLTLDLNHRVDEKILKTSGLFDYAFCLEVFEYIWNPVMALYNIKTFLMIGGTAYISFPTVYPPHNPEGMDYLRYTLDGIEKLLNVAEFRNWTIEPRVATKGLEALKEFYSLEGMHARREDPSIYNIGYLVKALK